MKKMHYQIVVKSPEDWIIVHELLTKDGTLEDNIPSRAVECTNEIPYSQTRSTYLLSEDEVELLKQNDKILSVDYDYIFHPEYAIKCDPSIYRFNKNVKNIRSIKRYDTSTGEILYNIPTIRESLTSSDLNRTGYQILRCTSETNPFPSNSSTIVNRDIQYSNDGTDVDVIVVDNGVWFGHPEFCSDASDPPNYVRGNVLSRHALCGVLDLLLDGPYYMDPEWFDANPTNRLVTRWDGTRMPIRQVAVDWWASSTNRSSAFNNRQTKMGTFIVPVDYTRVNHTGNQKSVPANPSKGDHGTPCAALAYGKNYGWAFNANKWSLKINLGDDTTGISAASSFDVIQMFHMNKPINPKFATRNPTVSSNSWGVSVNLNDNHTSGYYSYRGGPRTFYTNSNYPSFVKGVLKSAKVPYSYTDGAEVQSGRDMIDAGVLFVCSAGNEGVYIGTPVDEDFNNYIENTNLTRIYPNRPAFPAEIGYTPGQTTRNKNFIIGAIDDEYTGRYALSSETNSTFISQPSGKETLARYGELSNSDSSDYSNRGSAIDFYAPADGVISANSNDQTLPLPFPYPYQQFSDFTYYDEYFDGTSAACPVTAGLVACFVQNNRDLSPYDTKMYLRGDIGNQSTDKFFVGVRPGSDPNDPAWSIPFNVTERAVKIIREVTSRNATLNSSFTPTYGVLSGGSVNEKFTITYSAAFRNTLKIYGIQTFSNYVNSGTFVTLQITNGYYLVGSTNRLGNDADGTPFATLDKIAVRVDPTNNKRVQLSDSNGLDSWDDLEITVQNGYFQKVGTQIYYIFNGGSLASTPTSFAPLPTTPTVTPTIPLGTYYVPPPGGGGTPPGSGAIVGGGDMSISGDIVAGGNITGLVSDERLKTNQKEIDNALEKLEKLNGFTYNFNDIAEGIGFDKNKRHSGVSAQDVNEVLPEAVAPAPANNDYLTVKYDKLIPLLIEAVKDLKNDIDEIKDNDNK